MSDFKGTPGPWVWDSEDGILARHEGIGIGSVFPCDPCRYRKGEFEYGAVTESNARLIAAAPESHEANKLSLTVLCAIRAAGVLSHDTNILRDLDSAIGANRAAIAKATGEQP